LRRANWRQDEQQKKNETKGEHGAKLSLPSFKTKSAVRAKKRLPF